MPSGPGSGRRAGYASSRNSPTTAWPGASVRPSGLCHDPTMTNEPGAGASAIRGGEHERVGSGGSPVPPDRAGSAIIAVDTAGTAMFVATATLEAVLLQHWSELVGIAVALGLFVVGCLAFLAGYLQAIQRSRKDEIAIVNLYLLGGSTAPRRVLLRLN